MFSLIFAWTNNWANNGDAGDLRRHRAHYDVIVMNLSLFVRNDRWIQQHIFNSSPLDKITSISQTTFSSPFSWMKSLVFWFEFHWSLLIFGLVVTSRITQLTLWCDVDKPFVTLPIIQFCVSFCGQWESWSSLDAGKATWFIMTMHMFWAYVHHRLNWVPSPLDLFVLLTGDGEIHHGRIPYTA